MKYAVGFVGFVSFSDKDMLVEIVEANDWKSALLKHSKIGTDEADLLSKLPSDLDLELVKQAFFDCDSMIDVVEIKS